MLRPFLEEHRVDAIVVAPGTRTPQRDMVNALGLVPQRIADAIIQPMQPSMRR